MPSRITSTGLPLLTSTTERIEPVQEPSEPPEPQDIVDISIDGDPNAPGQLQNYGPATIQDRFKFDIENGRFTSKGRYTPLTTRFEAVANATYDSRGEIGSRLNVMAGQNSAQSALFALGYQNASPDATHASSNVDARTQENRRIDNNLDLLNLL